MRQFGLIGRPLGHSASATYFEEKFQREGITDAHYALYELDEIEQLPQLIAEHPDLRGLNVTIPYKRDVMRYLDEVSYEAQNIGAVNCIRRHEDGRLTGHNTDIEGLRKALDQLLGDAEPQEALILGTGGASQAVQYALMEREIGYLLVSRDLMRGNYTYDNLPCEVVESAKLIINTTPVGMYPHVDEAPRIPYAYVTPEHFLLDLIYRPEVTDFMDYGMQRGARVMNGLVMFREQAEASWRIWNE